MHFWARSIGIPYTEYHLMTAGEIQDLVACSAIANGGAREVAEKSTEYIPDVR